MAGNKYVEMGGKQIYRQPFAATGVQYYGFMMGADTAALQTNICDKLLNEPSGGAVDFAPFGPWVMVVYNNIAKLASTEPPDSNQGWFTERESAIWVLLVDRKTNKPYWFLPYICVDNSYALCMGRELYGFPKALGQFVVPTDPKTAKKWSLDSLVVPTFGPDVEGEWKNLWTTVDQDAKDAKMDVLDDIGELMNAAKSVIGAGKGILDDLDQFWELLKEVLAGDVPMVFLKQFPSVTDPTEAAYQAIVTCTLKMTGFNGGALLEGDYETTVANYDSHPIRTDCGLAEGPIKPFLSFYANLDFFIGNGEVVWEAP